MGMGQKDMRPRPAWRACADRAPAWGCRSARDRSAGPVRQSRSGRMECPSQVIFIVRLPMFPLHSINPIAGEKPRGLDAPDKRLLRASRCRVLGRAGECRHQCRLSSWRLLSCGAAWGMRLLPLARLLVIVLGLIGVGSFLFHTHAQAWAALADVVPILCFVLIYIYAANRGFWRMGRLAALFGHRGCGGAVRGAGAAAGAHPVGRWLGGVSAFAAADRGLRAGRLRVRAPRTARNLLLGAGLLVASLTIAQQIDGPLLRAVPDRNTFRLAFAQCR